MTRLTFAPRRASALATVRRPLRHSLPRWIVLATFLSALLLALSAPALSQQTRRTTSDQMRVFVDVNSFIASMSAGAPAAQLRATIDKHNADINAQQDALQKLQAQYQRDEALLGPQQKSARIAQLNAVTRDLDIKRQEARTDVDLLSHTLRLSTLEKLEAALADYTRGNAIGTIEMVTDMRSVIVRSGVHDITDSLLEMARSGPGAEAPAPPRAPPVVHYVDFQRAIKGSGFQAASSAAQSARTAESRLGIETLENARIANLDRLNSQQRFSMTQAEVERLNAAIESADRAREDMIEDLNRVLQELARSHESFFSERLEQAVRTGAFAARADVVRVINRDSANPDGIRIADPSLDLTPGASAALKGLLPPS